MTDIETFRQQLDETERLAKEQLEDPQRWPAEIWFDPEVGRVTVEVNGAKRYRTWIVEDFGELRTTWEWHPPTGAVQLLDPAWALRWVAAAREILTIHAPKPEPPPSAGALVCVGCPTPAWGDPRPWPCPTVRALMSVYEEASGE